MKGEKNKRNIDIPFRKEICDVYIVRTSILKSIKDTLHMFNGKLLDAGCGKMPYRDLILKESSINTYVGLDIESALVYDSNVKPNFTWDGITMPFNDFEFDVVFATEVLEHCPDPQQFINESYRVLKQDGVFFFTVPFLWPLHEVPNDSFRYTPFTLEKMFNKAGFRTICLKPMGGWHASMAQILGLWVKRSPLPSLIRKALLFIIKPVIILLLKLEVKSSVKFEEGQMITGLTGYVIK